MAVIDKDLLAIERKFWTEGSDFFRQNTDETCLVAFADMAGEMPREDLAHTAEGGNKWRDLVIEPKGIVTPVPEVSVLTYAARAVRTNGEPYAALVSTGYVKRKGGWKMMFHSQTPLETGQANKKD